MPKKVNIQWVAAAYVVNLINKLHDTISNNVANVAFAFFLVRVNAT